ncbi:MAG: TfoX/Sxy family protein [Candidatus Thiodiazotropha lotti]|uniref:TfoX/Sxy family protein n=1 Tax=Candidatus Thiodiazotropha lotti TaxID=2792787 RepID=A0A9E4N3B9_9GAMM|nr:TfoX/Sxy family protein [Candidatus Thiodiazotropha lotti]ODC02019.1 competence-specific regulator [Candidatus Thiodiazotropha endoloripes]MCG7922523.1 TfoX/Sxy family protein [Candidatus Thiodiazotropha lotti]MCG7932646.1 TfoX/Sxy family protein [Candidatus Thiodiazotropha lotti]MCG7941434.1 TfoX/Sxy family protein [Candidatus Thiodiazotropha lotti]
MGELSRLKGLGPKSEKALNEVGISTRRELEDVGAVGAYKRLMHAGGEKPSLNFLYAMVGALEERHWSEIAKVEKARLLMELEDSYQLDEILGQDAIDRTPESKRED